MTDRKDLPISFMARLANLCSMSETDMALILNRMLKDGYVTRVTKGTSYLFANLTEPAAQIAASLNAADQRIRARTQPEKPLTITAEKLQTAAATVATRARKPIPRDQPDDVRAVLRRQRALLEADQSRDTA